jgi:hypothetical protein
MTWWNFYFQIFEKAIGKEEVVEFLMRLLRHLSGPLLIIWDRLPAHRSRLVAAKSMGQEASTNMNWRLPEPFPHRDEEPIFTTLGVPKLPQVMMKSGSIAVPGELSQLP